jgi:D-alanine-D-alanine ligase
MKHVVLLCGGRSAEHEVSLASVQFVMKSLDKQRFRVSVVGINKDGSTMSAGELRAGLKAANCKGIEFPEVDRWIGFLQKLNPETAIVFPVLHGPFGEDGTVQGVLEVLDLPYVGASVGGSAVGMNKAYCKAILKSAGLPVLPALTADLEGWKNSESAILDKATTELSFPLFVKPLNMGSSVGISRCVDRDELRTWIEKALDYDDFVLIEQGIDAREIEVSVLGSLDPRVSVPGEIIPDDVFYSYESKYISGSSRLVIPAQLESGQTEEISRLAVQVFKVLQLEGMARVDFLVEKETGEIWVNEPNTIPGFTDISMYPKLWEASGLPAGQLLSELVEVGVQRYRRRSRLKVDR